MLRGVVLEPSSFILFGQKRLVTVRARPTSKGRAIDNGCSTGLRMLQRKYEFEYNSAMAQ